MTRVDLTALPPKVRAVIYYVYVVAGLGLGSTQVGYSAAGVDQPVWLTVAFAVFGRVSMAISPPFSANGVMLVTLSMNRCVGTSVSLAVMSRETDSRCCPSRLKAVPSTQSEWVPIWRTCLPVAAS